MSYHTQNNKQKVEVLRYCHPRLREFQNLMLHSHLGYNIT